MAGATMVPEPVFDVGAVMERIERGAHHACCPDRRPSYQSHPRPSRPARATTCRRCGWWSPAPPSCRSSWSRPCGPSSASTTVLTAYGLTESCGTVTMCRRGDPPEVIAGTSGRAIPDVEVRIVGRDGPSVPTGRGRRDRGARLHRHVGATGQRAEATDEAIDADGWLHTGDIGVMDEDGNVTITDRLKDMYVCGGFNVYPAEIEAVLRGHPGGRPGGGDRRARRADGRGGLRLRGARRPAGGRPDELATSSSPGPGSAMANYKVPRAVSCWSTPCP